MAVTVVSQLVKTVIKEFGLNKSESLLLRNAVKLLSSDDPTKIFKQELLNNYGMDYVGNMEIDDIRKMAKKIKGKVSLDELLIDSAEQYVKDFIDNDLWESYDEFIKFVDARFHGPNNWYGLRGDDYIILRKIYAYLDEFESGSVIDFAKAIRDWSWDPNERKFEATDWYVDGQTIKSEGGFKDYMIDLLPGIKKLAQIEAKWFAIVGKKATGKANRIHEAHGEIIPIKLDYFDFDYITKTFENKAKQHVLDSLDIEKLDI